MRWRQVRGAEYGSEPEYGANVAGERHGASAFRNVDRGRKATQNPFARPVRKAQLSQHSRTFDRL